MAKIKGGKLDGEFVFSKAEGGKYKDINLKSGKIKPLPDIDNRQVCYIAGPSGSGKTTYALDYIRSFLVLFPEKQFFLFSRTDYKLDPAYKGLTPIQVMIDNTLVDDPIDITEELTDGCIILFDDCNTIHDDKARKAVEKLICDILEVGRKLNIYIVITNHLIIPNEKKIARTILNEMQMLTVFPKSGSVNQISYVMKQYFGFSKKQIDKMLQTDSRWVTVKKTYPQLVISEKSIYSPL